MDEPNVFRCCERFFLFHGKNSPWDVGQCLFPPSVGRGHGSHLAFPDENGRDAAPSLRAFVRSSLHSSGAGPRSSFSPVLASLGAMFFLCGLHFFPFQQIFRRRHPIFQHQLVSSHRVFFSWHSPLLCLVSRDEGQGVSPLCWKSAPFGSVFEHCR